MASLVDSSKRHSRAAGYARVDRFQQIAPLIQQPPVWPPQLRPQGFEIWAGDASEIVQGKMRRNMLAGHRLIELWKDGLFTFIAPGDEDFLGWRMHGFDKPIHISNFVLAVSVLMFCWLVKLIYEEADPKPPVLRLTVGFDNLTRPAGPATLGSAPEGKMRFPGDTRKAPAPSLAVYQLAELKDYDPERLAYLLIAGIYNDFGYEAMSVPYINLSDPKPKIKAKRLRAGSCQRRFPRRTLTDADFDRGIFTQIAHTFRCLR